MGNGLVSAGWRWAVPVMVAALVSTCTPESADSSRSLHGDGQGAPRSALSAFLAGRFAVAVGDTRSAADYFTAALQFEPDNEEFLQRAFVLLLSEGRIEQAIPLAERLLTYDADSALGLLLLGLRDAKAGYHAEAEGRFAQIPKRNVFAILEPFLVAWARQGQGHTDAALASLDQMSNAKALTAIKFFHMALINDQAGRTVAAASAYANSTNEHLAIRQIEMAGSFYNRTGQSDKAKLLLDQYRATQPGSLVLELANWNSKTRPVADAGMGMAEILFDMASLMRQNNAPDMPMIFLRLAMYMQPDFPLAQMVAAEILGQQDQIADSIALYQSINSSSSLAALSRLRIATGLDQMGRTDDAIAELNELTSNPRFTYEALLTKGDIFRNHRRFGEAITAYTHALNRVGQLEPHHWNVLFSRAICYDETQQWALAEADFKRSLDLRPDQPDVLNYLGYSWVDRGLNLEEGRRLLEKAVALRPRDGAIVDSLGWALYRMGLYNDALLYLERAVELRPQDAVINDHLGDVYWQVGRKAEAIFQWQRALTLNPDDRIRDALKAKLQDRQQP